MVLYCLKYVVFQNKHYYFCINNVIFLYIIYLFKFPGCMYYLHCTLYVLCVCPVSIRAVHR
jgi:hypothetical protein